MRKSISLFTVLFIAFFALNASAQTSKLLGTWYGNTTPVNQQGMRGTMVPSLTLKDGKIINDSPMNAEDVKMLYEENKNNEYIMSWIFMSDTHPLVIVPVDINPLMTFFYRIGLFFQFKKEA